VLLVLPEVPSRGVDECPHRSVKLKYSFLLLSLIDRFDCAMNVLGVRRFGVSAIAVNVSALNDWVYCMYHYTPPKSHPLQGLVGRSLTLITNR